MMHVVNPTEIELLTQGERYTLDQKLKKLFSQEDCYIYVQPTLNQQRFDFILIGPTFGVLIIEVKDWSDDYILSANRNFVVCQENQKFKNPNVQVEGYQNIVNHKLNAVFDFVDDHGELNIPVRTFVFYPHLTASGLDRFPELKSDCHHIFVRQQLRQLELSDLVTQTPVQLSREQINGIRGSLFSEIMIPSETLLNEAVVDSSEIRALDIEQEEFAKKVPNGHYMVTGIPGSGKTVILLSRALHLVHTHEDHQVLILTFTKALSNKLQHQLKLKALEMNITEQCLQRIEIMHFHGLCKSIIGYDSQKYQATGSEYFNTYWPRDAIAAINGKIPRYDAVLVDEYQDFHQEWFELCKAVCRKTDQGIENLFFAGDRLQRIYNVTWNSYKELGIHIQGRSKLLKTPYRTNQNHFDFALRFLSEDKTLAKDIANFYEIDNFSATQLSTDAIEIHQGGAQKTIDSLLTLLSKHHYKPEDVMILCHRNQECKEMLRIMPEYLKRDFVEGKEPQPHKGLITTYHSSKGLESKACILYKIEDFEVEKKNRILMYVGMTRASEKLILNYQYSKHFAAEILEISQH